MLRLSLLDAMFLLLERQHAPFHVGALSLFRPPAGAGAGFGTELAGRLRQSCKAGAPFNKRLVQSLGRNYWTNELDFDLDHHFVHVALPEGGKASDLPQMIARMHGVHLDRGYPLWRTYLIEGLEDGRIATYSKIHHSLVDGVAGIRLMLKSMSQDERMSVAMPAPWGINSQNGFAGTAPSAAAAAVDAAGSLGGLSLIPVLYRQLKQTLQDFREHHPDLVTSFQAPRTIFNQDITGSRRFAARSYSMARIKAVASSLGGGTNDVVMALCAAALRHYLRDHGGLPARPLIAAVPVSLRADDSDSGNAVAGALVNLATHMADPVERFHAIKRSMDYSKARLRQMTPAQLYAYSAAMLAPGLLTMLPGMRRGIANLVISNVPGPKQPMFWQGCQLDAIYPVSLLLNGFALNITLVSGHDTVDFGLLGCSRTVPAMHLLLDHLEDALVELEDLTGPAMLQDIRSRSGEEAPPSFPSSRQDLPLIRHSGESRAPYLIRGG